MLKPTTGTQQLDIMRVSKRKNMPQKSAKNMQGGK
jgi:hypothetical protein